MISILITIVSFLVAACYYKELIRINEGKKNITEDFFNPDIIYLTHSSIQDLLNNNIFIKEDIVKNAKFNVEYIKNMNLDQISQILSSTESSYTLLHA